MMTTRDKTLLIVDDAPDNIQLLSGLLKAQYKVKAATGGEKALSIAQKAPHPDLILLDVVMPGMDGYQVCEKLKADTLTANIPVVFVTGHSSEKERRRGMEMGGAGYLSKPVDPRELFDVLERILVSN